jgi:uncharacterized protein (DUF1778 family)
MTNEMELAREIDELKDSGRELDGYIPVKARVSETPRAVFSLRLAPGELAEISKAAQERRSSVGDFVRSAALAAARGDIQTEVSATIHELRSALSRLEEAYGTTNRNSQSKSRP